MVNMRTLGLLAVYTVTPACAAIVNRAAASARATDHAELLEKSANGISPVPTAEPKPDLVAMELFKRTLGSDTCGWYGDYKCMNIGRFDVDDRPVSLTVIVSQLSRRPASRWERPASTLAATAAAVTVRRSRAFQPSILPVSPPRISRSQEQLDPVAHGRYAGKFR